MMITQKFYMLCPEKANPSVMMTEGMYVNALLAGLAEQLEHIRLVELDSGLVEGVDA